ncbi:hypothetical protein TNCV_1120921 [Trichonephila clavipes]|uniref:Uncharacterized protein n=1 Tax=Trichonephila clavipes TaxID=2585209 RepID=A0A8X6VSB3_TRICX|nr:hypothetical protein TNCV_1120921 [Trichonephila clavipes]
MSAEATTIPAMGRSRQIGHLVWRKDNNSCRPPVLLREHHTCESRPRKDRTKFMQGGAPPHFYEAASERSFRRLLNQHLTTRGQHVPRFKPL